MKNYFLPHTHVGKLSVGLNMLFLAIIFISIILVMVFKVLNFDDHWWDVTVLVAFVISMSAFFTVVRATKKYKDHSVLVYLSIVIGMGTILFIFAHSLFIKY